MKGPFFTCLAIGSYNVLLSIQWVGVWYYLCITFAGFQGLPGLSANHYVTLSIIRRYLDFKVILPFLISGFVFRATQ